MRLDRMAAKVVTGVGSAAKSARRIVSRIGSAPDGVGPQPQASRLAHSEAMCKPSVLEPANAKMRQLLMRQCLSLCPVLV